MNFFYTRLAVILTIGYLLALPILGNAQVQTAKYITINSNTHGYYEYLPEGYDASGSEKYPLLVFLHGQGDLGNGRSDLSSLLKNGPPRYINEGKFPASFIVNGHEFRFLVISPQFENEPSSADVNEVLDYAEENYKVDPERIYITGTSMGGGATWEYCASGNLSYIQRLAGIVPVCGKSAPDRTKANRIADNGLPVWAFHNNGDNVVPAAYTINYIQYIRERTSASNPVIRMTIFDADGHDAWTKAYDPDYEEENMNMYEWLLQYAREGSAEGPLPVVLSDYRASLTSDQKNLIAWSTTFEQNNSYFTIERSQDGISFQEIARIPASNASGGSAYSYTDEDPLSDISYYRLSQTDLNGKTTRFEIISVNNRSAAEKLFTVYPNPASDYLQVTLDNEATGGLRISIVDQNGRNVKTAHYFKQGAAWKQRISVAGLGAGYYMLEVREANGNCFIKGFIKK